MRFLSSFLALCAVGIACSCASLYGSDDEPASTADGGGIDAAQDAAVDAGADVSTAAERCDPAKPFGTPQPLTTLNAPLVVDTGLRLSPDELTVYFSSFRNNRFEIFTASRSSRDAVFEPPLVILTDATLNFTTPTLTADGLELFVEMRGGAQSDGGPLLDRIGATRRASTAASFSLPSTITSITPDGGAPATTGTPFLSRTGLELFFARVENGAGRIFMARRSSVLASFQPGQPIVEIASANDASQDQNPLMRADGLELYFASTRSGRRAPYRARRVDIRDPWSNIEPVSELIGTGTLDAVTWITDDGCVAYVISDRATGTGPDGADLYVAARPR